MDLNKNRVIAEVDGNPVLLNHLWKRVAVLEAIYLSRWIDYRSAMGHIPTAGLEE